MNSQVIWKPLDFGAFKFLLPHQMPDLALTVEREPTGELKVMVAPKKMLEQVSCLGRAAIVTISAGINAACAVSLVTPFVRWLVRRMTTAPSFERTRG